MMFVKANVLKVESNFSMLYNLCLSKTYSEEEAPGLLHTRKQNKDKYNKKMELKKDKNHKKLSIQHFK